MTVEEAIELITSILARYVGVEPSAIAPDMHLQEELGLDSIDAAELLIVLREKTGQTVDVESLEDVTTIRRLAALLVGLFGTTRTDLEGALA